MYSAINRSIVHIARINGSVILDMQMSMASSEGRTPNRLALANTSAQLAMAKDSLLLRTKDTDRKNLQKKERAWFGKNVSHARVASLVWI